MFLRNTQSGLNKDTHTWHAIALSPLTHQKSCVFSIIRPLLSYHCISVALMIINRVFHVVCPKFTRHLRSCVRKHVFRAHQTFNTSMTFAPFQKSIFAKHPTKINNSHFNICYSVTISRYINDVRNLFPHIRITTAAHSVGSEHTIPPAISLTTHYGQACSYHSSAVSCCSSKLLLAFFSAIREVGLKTVCSEQEAGP